MRFNVRRPGGLLLASSLIFALGATVASPGGAVAQTGPRCVSRSEFGAIKAGMSRWRIEHMADARPTGKAWQKSELVATYPACGAAGSEAYVTYRIKTRADGTRHFLATGEKRLLITVPTYSHTNRPV